MDKAEKIRRILDPEAAREPRAAPGHYFAPGYDAASDPRRLAQRFPRLYAFLQDLLTPTLTTQRWQDEVPDVAANIVVNLGAGAYPLHAEMINVDLVAFPHTDITADFAEPLPIRSGSVDAVLSIAVLEHLRHPALMASEMERILKPGGTLYVNTPFLYPFHDAPEDYTRWTLLGLRTLMGGSFEVVSSGSRGGAMGVVILALAHAGAQVVSFGSPRVYALANFAGMGLLAPLKLLDLLLARLPFDTMLCPSLYLTLRKKPAAGPPAAESRPSAATPPRG